MAVFYEHVLLIQSLRRIKSMQVLVSMPGTCLMPFMWCRPVYSAKKRQYITKLMSDSVLRLSPKAGLQVLFTVP